METITNCCCRVKVNVMVRVRWVHGDGILSGFNVVSGTAADRPYMHASHADYRGEASRQPRV